MANWQKVKISQFLKEREGRYDPGDEAVLGLKRLNKIDFSGEIHLSDKSSKTDMIIVEPGDLVISGINVSKGALAVYHGEEPITATIHYSSYAFDERQIDIDYFKRFVRSQSFVQTLKDQVKGGIKTEIKPKHFLPLEILLPDIESQKELVSFFKGIENEMGDLSGEISHQQSFLKQLRQRILQEAIEGKLTVKWRKQHPELISGDNHASKLLEKIKAEKERLIEEGKIKKDKPLAPITDAEKPFDLPQGWAWCRLGEVIELLMGQSPDGISYNTACKGVPLVNGPVEFGGMKPFEKTVAIKFTTQPTKMCKKGDLLLCVRGSTTGRTNIAGYDSCIGRGVAAVRPILMESPYLNYLILNYRNSFYDLGTGSTFPNISQDKITNFKIALPSIAEQQVIVRRVGNLMTNIDELEKQVSERKDQAQMLMQSVLREAFTKG